MIFSLAAQGTLDVYSVGKTLIGTLVFLGISFTIGRRLVFWLIRWANDHLVSSAAVITVILLVMSGMAMITHLIGVHTVLGAFVAGVLVGESPILTRQIDERLRGLISSLFMPVFFGLADTVGTSQNESLFSALWRPGFTGAAMSVSFRSGGRLAAVLARRLAGRSG